MGTDKMPNTDPSAEATRPPPPSTTGEPDVPLPLRSARRTLLWSARALCFGFFLGLVTILSGAIAVDARGPSAVFWILSAFGITSAALIVLGLLGTVASGLVWLSIVYFGYTRFSLRTLLIAVWVLAAILALIVAGNEQLRAIGIPLLIVFVIVLVARVAVNDPLASPGLKELIAPEEKTKPSNSKKTD
jgi:hypothetical protein